jgi:uncharacterized iron-regulated membrane protein
LAADRPPLRRKFAWRQGSSLRTVVFWLHLAAGVTAGAVVLVMSLTGLLLSFETQVEDWANRDLRVEPAAGSRPLAPSALLARAAAEEPDLPISGITFSHDPADPAYVSAGRGQGVYADPYTGELLGEGDTGVSRAFRTLMGWHRWLGQEGKGRDMGRAITGAANLAFLFLVLSGLYLWMPRVWSRKRVRQVIWFRRGLSSKARDFNWHHVFGIWAWAPLVLVVASGVVMSYSWAGDLLYTVAGEEAPQRGGPGRGGGEDAAEVPFADRLAGLDAASETARNEVPGWKTLQLRLPEPGADTVDVSVSRGGRGQVHLRESLTLDRAGRVTARETFSDLSRGRRLRSWARWVHTGEAGGLPGQVLGAFVCLAGLFLVWTGIALSWRRFFRRPVRQAATDDLSLDESETLGPRQRSLP